MSDFTCDYRHLDSNARDYLASVAAGKGRGAPGIYIAGGSNALPIISLLLGFLVLFIGWVFAFASLKEPWAVALLFTAGTLLGGWMIVYPFRRWFGGGLGSFTYCDPLNVYEVNGSEVAVTNIRELSTLNVEEVFANSNYSKSKLHFHLPGKLHTAEVNNRKRADLVADYYAVLASLAEDA